MLPKYHSYNDTNATIINPIKRNTSNLLAKTDFLYSLRAIAYNIIPNTYKQLENAKYFSPPA